MTRGRWGRRRARIVDAAAQHVSQCATTYHPGGRRHPARPRRASAAVGQRVLPGGDLFDEITDVANGASPFGQNVGSQREIVDLSVPQMQIAADSRGVQPFRHQLGAGQQQFVGARVDGHRGQSGQIGIHR